MTLGGPNSVRTDAKGKCVSNGAGFRGRATELEVAQR